MGEELSEIELRGMIISLCALVEDSVSKAIAISLNFQGDLSKSVLGYASNSISLKQKQLILSQMESEVLTKEVKKKFETFIQIRNKFAHVPFLSSWEGLKSMGKGSLLKELESYFPEVKEKQKDKRDEIRLTKCYKNLSSELQIVFYDLAFSFIERDVKRYVNDKLYDFFSNRIDSLLQDNPITPANLKFKDQILAFKEEAELEGKRLVDEELSKYTLRLKAQLK